MDETYKDFNNNTAYYQTLADTDPTEQAEEYNFAYASYIDARKLFNGIKLSPGYLPIVALTDGGGAASPQFSIFQCPPGRGKEAKRRKERARVAPTL